MKYSFSSIFNAITVTATIYNQISCRIDFLSQSGYVHINGALYNTGVIGPDFHKKFFSGEYMPYLLQKERQNGKFRFCELNLLSIDRYIFRIKVKNNIF